MSCTETVISSPSVSSRVPQQVVDGCFFAATTAAAAAAAAAAAHTLTRPRTRVRSRFFLWLYVAAAVIVILLRTAVVRCRCVLICRTILLWCSIGACSTCCCCCCCLHIKTSFPTLNDISSTPSSVRPVCC